MRKLIIVLTVIAVGAILGYYFLMKDFEHQQSIIFHNGTIYTIENENPEAEAIFVEKGIIKKVGTNKEILQMKGAETKMVDLNGKTMMPGFIDPHTHVALSSFLHPMVDLSGFTHQTEQEVWDHLRSSVPGFEEGEWIICKGLDPILVEGLRSPKIDFLDEIVPDNPLIILSQSLHTYWANTRAFKAVGINKDTPDPSTSSYYEKDNKGELTGLIAEQEAFVPFTTTFLGTLDPETLVNATVDVMKAYAKRGNTTLVSTGLSVSDDKPLRLYRHLSAGKPELLNQVLSVAGMLPARAPYPRHFIYMRHDRVRLLPESPENGDDFYKILGVKHWYDGSPYTGSMYLSQPYMTSELTTNGLHIKPGYSGKRLVEFDSFVEWIKKYHTLGWQISVHTQGDLAIDEVLDAFEQINGSGNDISRARHRLEHCLLMQAGDLSRAKSLNISPSFHINHLYYYGKALQNELIGEVLSDSMLPLNTASQTGVRFSLHADQPMFESHPFRLIQTAVERRSKEGLLIGEQEAITLRDAIKTLTIDAAWQIHMDDRIGSIKSGKYADLIILDKDPFRIPVTDLDKIEILETYVHGNQIEY